MTKSWATRPQRALPEGDWPGAESYRQARERLIHLLIRHTLVASYQKFVKAREPYPFVAPATLRPGSVTSQREHTLHNHALVVLVDGPLPEALRKNFRCREANRINKKNLQEVAPDLANVDHYECWQRNVNNEDFGDLLAMLLDLDYALLVQRSPPEESGELGVFHLSHFHVKIERLTDSALCSIGRHLNYVQRELYEHGEAFVEALERKFFEYFNFYRNAAGRRSAAALAAQLLSQRGLGNTVLVTSQEDRRLTVLTSDMATRDIAIEQYLLLRIGIEELRELTAWAKGEGLQFARHYLVARGRSCGVVVLRVRYEHTEAAQPSADGRLKPSFNPREKWVRLREEMIVPIHPGETTRILFPTAYRRQTEPSCHAEVL